MTGKLSTVIENLIKECESLEAGGASITTERSDGWIVRIAVRRKRTLLENEEDKL